MSETRLRALGALCLLSLAACGSEEEPVFVPQPLERVALELQGARGDAASIQSVLVLIPDQANWKSDGVRVAPREESTGFFAPSDAPAASLELAWEGEFQRGEFQRVNLITEGTAPTSCSLHLLRGGQSVFDSQPQSLLPEQRELAFELAPPEEGQAAEFDALVLRILKPEGSWGIRRVELQEVPPANYFPTDTGVHWVRLHRDARRARSLWVGETWRADIDLRGPSRLLLGFGRPVQADRGEELFLELVMKRGEERNARRIDLAAVLGREETWYSVTSLLGPASGSAWKQGRVELELSLSGGSGGAIAMETPIVDRVRRDAPVVVLVTSDTHRADHVGRLDPKGVARTPTLDALAAEGLSFRDAYATSNYTVPSHSAILTGAHPRQTLVIDNSDALGPEAVTLAERFEEAGFLCVASVSAAHLDAISSGLGQGFQRFSSPDASQRDSRPTFQQVRRWLKDLHGRPLFLWIHSFDAHVPYAPPKPLLHEYYPTDRNPYDRSLPELPYHVSPAWLPGLRDVEFARAAYAAEVTYFDARLGELFQHPVLQGARVAVTADHGESLGEQDSWFNHGLLNPPVLSVPLILSGPGLPQDLTGQVVEHKVSHLDLGRTLLDWADLKAADFPGRNLLEEPEAGRPRYAVANLGRSVSMELGDWFLVLHLVGFAAPGREPWERHQVELYDLSADPDCEHDLSGVEFERARRMRELLIDFLVSTEDLGWHSLVQADHTRQAHIRALGYVAGDDDERVQSDWFPLDCDCARCLPFRE